MRLGVVGAGRAFERLYLPALGFTPALELVAVADPLAGRRRLAEPVATGFPSLEAMLDGATLDALAILTPHSHRNGQVETALVAGLGVLVEKPVAASTDALGDWGEIGAGDQLTPALSRRYWPRYRAAAEGAQRATAIRIALTTSPHSWAAITHGESDVAADLLPHLIDLARTLTGSPIEEVRGALREGRARVRLTLASGQVVHGVARYGHRYDEWLELDGERLSLRRSPLASLRDRLRGRTPPDIAGLAELLTRWAARVTGVETAPPPTYADAWANVSALEAFRRSAREGSKGVAPRIR